LPRPSNPYHNRKRDNSKLQRSTAKAAEVGFHIQEDAAIDPDEDQDDQVNHEHAPDITDTLFMQYLHDPEEHTPAAQMAEYQFPSVNMASTNFHPVTQKEQRRHHP